MFKNELISRFSKNFTWLFLFNNLSYVFAIISIPILISKYGTKEMGTVFTIQSLMFSVSILANYSLTFYIPTITKEIKTDSDFTSKIWQIILNTRLYLSVFLIGVSFVIVYFFYYNFMLFWLLSLPILFGKIINPTLICNAIEKNKHILYISFFSKLLFLICIVIFTNIKLVNFFLGITEFIVILYYLPKINSRFRSFTFIGFTKIHSFLKKTYKLFLVNLFSMIKPAMILPSISYFLGNQSVTLYTLADKIMNYIRGISGAMFVSFYPIFNEHKETLVIFNWKRITTVFILSIISISTIYFTSPYVIYYLNNFEYSILASKTLQILSLSIPVFFIIIPLFSYLLEHKKWNNILLFAFIQVIFIITLILLYHQNITQIATDFVITEYSLLLCYIVNVYLFEKRKSDSTS